MRNLGKVVHYAKVQLRFQHSQVGAGPGWGVHAPGAASPPAWGSPDPALTTLLPAQDVSDCYLELFPAHLYFQAHGSEGLTFQVRQWAVGVGPWPPFPPWIPEAPTLCLAGAVTTDGAERLPAGGVPRARLPDHRCLGCSPGPQRHS